MDINDISYGTRTEGISISVETSKDTMEDIISKFDVKATGSCNDATSHFCEFDTNTPRNAEFIQLAVANNWTVNVGWSLIEDEDNDKEVQVEMKDGVITNYYEEVYENS